MSTLNEDKENEIDEEIEEDVEKEKSKGKEKITEEPLDKIKGENNPNPKQKIYKAKDKASYDKHIHRIFFQVHDKVWQFNSRLCGKVRSRWDDPYTVVKVFDNGAIIILDPKTGQSFTVNGQRSPRGDTTEAARSWL
ncbi:hypothetical protein Taro_051304 [Colocasia esculenta]|uniref:Uncharacterized protein n=1 Tax=Colocasia esculenta TaxID=4460 RepID=A0A843XGR0_COLES|nr:hypothetical protein [Colocasia esculenta]